MLTTVQPRDLRARYTDALLTVANEVGASDRTPAGAVALGRIRECLGVPKTKTLNGQVSEAEVRERVVQYVLALKALLQNFVQLDAAQENQDVVADLERELGGLL